MNPLGRFSLNVPQDVFDDVRRIEADQQMYVVGDAADNDWNASECIDTTAKISVKPVAPIPSDRRLLMLRSENEVVNQCVMRGRHTGDLSGTPAGVHAFFLRSSGGIRPAAAGLDPRLLSCAPPGRSDWPNSRPGPLARQPTRSSERPKLQTSAPDARIIKPLLFVAVEIKLVGS
jgi:hypothetical protein